MSTWRETAFKLELKSFEDGLNDARRHTVDAIAYQINQEYRNGVNIAQQLMTMLNVAQNEILMRPMEQLRITSIPVAKN